MAKHKHIDTQPRLIAVDLSRQLLPGTLEHALQHLLEHVIDLSHFDARFRIGYRRPRVSSGGAAEGRAVRLLSVCDAEGLIGREMFAIDGVKLPSDASKQRSGTRAESVQHESAFPTSSTTRSAATSRMNSSERSGATIKQNRRTRAPHVCETQAGRWPPRYRCRPPVTPLDHTAATRAPSHPDAPRPTWWVTHHSRS